MSLWTKMSQSKSYAFKRDLNYFLCSSTPPNYNSSDLTNVESVWITVTKNIIKLNQEIHKKIFICAKMIKVPFFIKNVKKQNFRLSASKTQTRY